MWAFLFEKTISRFVIGWFLKYVNVVIFGALDAVPETFDCFGTTSSPKSLKNIPFTFEFVSISGKNTFEFVRMAKKNI